MMDVYDLWEHREMELERRLDRRPKCECCRQPIQDEYMFDFYGDVYCEKCVDRLFRKEVPSEEF